MKNFLLLFTLCCLNCAAQQPYKQSDLVADLSASQMLNYATSPTSLKKLQGNITIIDFFGTWCAPCIKALPELKSYQEKFKDDVKVILVSIETKEKLSKFINSRQPFAFPMIVDADNIFTNALIRHPIPIQLCWIKI